MPDVYATITQADPTVQERLADVLELRASDPQQRQMLEAYLAKVKFPQQARVLEIGCGTGAVSRVIAERSGIAEVVGIDPCPLFVAKARVLGAWLANLLFEETDGRALPYEDRSFDAIVFHTTLCHIPEPERALAEAHRVLRPDGWLAIFDGDYTTTTVAIGDFDPLQACVDKAVASLVHDRWLVRRLSAVVQSVGFEVAHLRSHGYVETFGASYMPTLIDRGAEFLVASGCIGVEESEALKAEACRRVEAGEFFGHIAYASFISRKLAS